MYNTSIIELNKDIDECLLLLNLVTSIQTSTKTEQEITMLVDLNESLYPGFKAAAGCIATEGFVNTAVNIIERLIEFIANLLKTLYRQVSTLFSKRSAKLEKLESNMAIIKKVGHNIDVDMDNTAAFHDFENMKKNLMDLSIFEHRIQSFSEIITKIHSLHTEKLYDGSVTDTTSKSKIAELLTLNNNAHHDIGINYNSETHSVHFVHATETPKKKEHVITDLHSAISVYTQWTNCSVVSNKYYDALEKIRTVSKTYEQLLHKINTEKSQLTESSPDKAREIKGAMYCTKNITALTISIISIIENDILTMERITSVVSRFVSKYRKGVIE